MNEFYPTITKARDGLYYASEHDSAYAKIIRADSPEAAKKIFAQFNLNYPSLESPANLGVGDKFDSMCGEYVCAGSLIYDGKHWMIPAILIGGSRSEFRSVMVPIENV